MTIKGREYRIDQFGVITQTDHRPFKYTPLYSAIYDSPAYTAGNDRLMALRLGFVLGVHGRPVRSLLDAGYGNGAFINAIKEHVPYVYGHDVTGVPLDGAYLLPEFVKADVYTMWDVLEHFPDCGFLATLPAETLCISLPYCHYHTEGRGWMEENYIHLKPDEHIRHFNEWSLRAFMQSYGWRCVAISDHEDIVRKTKHGLKNILSAGFKRL
jgi:hypothetical protein